METPTYYLSDVSHSISAHLSSGITNIIRPHYNNLLSNHELAEDHNIRKKFYGLEKAAGKAANPKFVSIQLIGVDDDELEKELANSITKLNPNDKFKEKTAWVVQVLSDQALEPKEQIKRRLDSLPSEYSKCVILQVESDFKYTQRAYNTVKESLPSGCPVVILEAGYFIYHQLEENFKIELNRYTSSIISLLSIVYPTLSNFLNEIRPQFPTEYHTINTAILKFIKKYTNSPK